MVSLAKSKAGMKEVGAATQDHKNSQEQASKHHAAVLRRKCGLLACPVAPRHGEGGEGGGGRAAMSEGRSLVPDGVARPLFVRWILRKLASYGPVISFRGRRREEVPLTTHWLAPP